MIPLTVHTQTGNLISPRDACCQGIQCSSIWPICIYVFPGDPVLAICLLSLLLLVPNWGILASDGEGAIGTTFSAGPDFPRQFLAHDFTTPVLLHMPYGKLPTVLQLRIYGASEVFTALWQPCWMICFMMELWWVTSEVSMWDAETQLSLFLSLRWVLARLGAHRTELAHTWSCKAWICSRKRESIVDHSQI